MPRRLFNLCSILSLALGVAVAVLWVRSFHRQPPPAAYADRWLYSHGYVATDAGEVTAVYFNDRHGVDAPFDCRHSRRAGFGLDRWRGGSGWNSSWQYTSVKAPLGAAFAATLLLPLLWLLRRVSSSRRDASPAFPAAPADGAPNRTECGGFPQAGAERRKR